MGRRRNGAPLVCSSEQAARGIVRDGDVAARKRLAGLGLQAHDTMSGVPGLVPVVPSPARRRKVLRLSGHASHRLPRKGQALHEAALGRKRNPTRVCRRVTAERQRSTRFGEGSTRSEKDRGESASSALKRRRSRGAPHRDPRPKLAAANSSADPPLPWPREWRGVR